MSIDYTVLPEGMRGQAERYIEHGIEPSRFTQAVICNDLQGAFSRADHINRELMFDNVEFWYNEAPYSCLGSPEKMQAWLARDWSKPRKEAKALTIYECPISTTSDTVMMPRGARMLAVQKRDGRLFIWALVEPERPIVSHRIAIYGTWHSLPKLPGIYVGTWQGGPSAWHLFDLGEAP